VSISSPFTVSFQIIAHIVLRAYIITWASFPHLSLHFRHFRGTHP
jgi:hypothetical protein